MAQSCQVARRNAFYTSPEADYAGYLSGIGNVFLGNVFSFFIVSFLAEFYAYSLVEIMSDPI